MSPDPRMSIPQKKYKSSINKTITAYHTITFGEIELPESNGGFLQFLLSFFRCGSYAYSLIYPD